MPDDVAQDALARRITVAYDFTSLSIVAAEIVPGTVGSSDPLDDLTGASGFWYELRDAAGTPLWRRVTTNPMAMFREVSLEDDTFAVGRTDESSGTFDLTVPLLPDAATLAIVGASPDDPDSGAPASELASFDLAGV